MNPLQILLAVVMCVVATGTSAQSWPLPGATWEPPVLCSGCSGQNTFTGAPNDGAPTYPYTLPFADHIGRTVDSSWTQNFQHVGIRTVRAGKTRVSADGARLYMALGEAVGVYTLSTFFTERLLQPIAPVSVIKTGSKVSRAGAPLEKIVAPDAFFYAEATTSGWTTHLVDVQKILNDFDSDDRGYLYVTTTIYGWGIHRDDGRTNGTHLPYVTQQQTNYTGKTIFVLKNGTGYFAVLSGGASTSSRTDIYDVTTPSAPTAEGSTRSGSEHGIVAWAKNDATERLALITADGYVRVHTYAGFLAGAAPLAAFASISPKKLYDLSFDAEGALWVAEGTGGSLSSNELWKLTPSDGTYTKSTFDVYGGPFIPRAIHAGAGFVAVSGIESDGVSSASAAYALRLLAVNAGVPTDVDLGQFFPSYYYKAPAGYAQSPPYVQMALPHILEQGSKKYLFYNAVGLGDVYVLDDGTPVVSSISPVNGPTIGGTNVTMYGLNLAGTPTVTFDGQTVSSTLQSSTAVSAFAPHHAPGPGSVLLTLTDQTVPSPQTFTWNLDAPSNVTASMTSASSITVTWNGVDTAAHYEVEQRGAEGTSTTNAGAGQSLVHSDLAPNSGFGYRVRSVDSYGHTSAFSATDVATTVQFTDSTILPGMTIKLAHLTELREAVNALRAAGGLPAATFTDPTPTVVRSVHVSELQSKLQEAQYLLQNPSAFSWVTAGTTIKAQHFQELLSSVQ